MHIVMCICCDAVQEYLADGLHPVAAGLEVIAHCLEPLLEKLMPTAANATAGCGTVPIAGLTDVLQ